MRNIPSLQESKSQYRRIQIYAGEPCRAHRNTQGVEIHNGAWKILASLTRVSPNKYGRAQETRLFAIFSPPYRFENCEIFLGRHSPTGRRNNWQAIPITQQLVFSMALLRHAKTVNRDSGIRPRKPKMHL